MMNARWRLRLWPLAALVWLAMQPFTIGHAQSLAPLRHDVVINEIHYDPDVKTEMVEFIELYNKGTAAVNLSGWRLADAVEYTFPAGTSIPANGYLVVAQNPAAVQAKYKVQALGPWTGVLSNEGETIFLCDATKRVVDRVDYQMGFPWPTVGDAPGYSVELINPALDNALGGNWRSGGPTPGRRNAAFAVNAPPTIRQVTHTPQQPGSNRPVTVTAKVTDPEGVATVLLLYQVVNPGSYFSKDDPAFADPKNWVSLDMKDDGQGDDQAAGDGLYAVEIPAAIQVHRRLVRYMIVALDGAGATVSVPYADDPQPDFAYFVYDGVPAWSGAIQANSSDATKRQIVTYDFGTMPSLPVYHLITTRRAHEDSQHIPNSTTGSYSGSDYLWTGTLVYDGVVYDHIHFRCRGGVWRYSMGKNMWKMAFERGHDFQARDEYGRPLGVLWKKLNLGANIQQGDYGHRGEQGLFEYTGFKLFNLAGAPASLTFPAHFRIIENASETNSTPNNQYDDDFQGLYLAVEQPDGRFLDQHGLPDGNLYKMEGGGQLNNQGPTQPTNGSDLNSFTSGYSSNPTESWWRSNLDVQEYYAFRAITEGIHNGDIGYGKNYFYYHNPQTNQWSIVPWDLDLTWAETMYGNGNDPLKARLLYTDSRYSGMREPFNLEYRNRLREIMDLLYNSEQVGQMIDEYAALVNSPNPGASMVDADRAMWDYNPILTSSYVNSSKAGWGRFYQAVATRDFPGMAQQMKDYVTFVYTHTRNWMNDPSNGPSLTTLAADTMLPTKPTVTYIGPAGYPADRLSFRSSAYSSYVPFGAMKWRIAEVSNPTAPRYDPNDPKKYEIQAAWESPEITPFAGDVRIPTSVVEAGRSYRVRCRMKDLAGRWSNWSAPIQFKAGAPAAGSSLALRITEIMYHPPVSPSEDGWDVDAFEFLELTNIGKTTIDLTGARFVEGIKFDFAGSGVTQLAPNALVLVVANRLAFECRYGTSVSAKIAGEYSGSLANGGETIKLIDLQTGVVAQFAYADTWYALTDGQGRSLVPVNPSQVSPDQLGSKTAWRASYHWGGSPGASDTP
ncbi:MAG: lamin tail domain-containing protein [Phycisphaerae bacterium]|nr:lamin tail domain-containing protein [Phycisphaerae bacterium]